MSDTIASILATHRAGASPAETVARAYARIRAHNDPAIFITLRDEADAIAEARALAQKGDTALPLYGVPFAVKDNIDVGGLKISGGLALIGAVVAEFVAGTGGSASGLAYRILESGYRLQIPRMFAALLLISLSGIAIFFLTSWISYLLLRHWHESAIRREN